MVELGIIAAMALEAEPLIAQMQNTNTETVSGITFTKGDLFGHTVVVAVCGIGKVFAALCAQTMLLRYAPCAVINTGVAGSLSTKLKIGDLAVAERVAQHDMDTSAIGDPVGLISGINEIYLPADADIREKLLSAARAVGVNTLCGTIASGDPVEWEAPLSGRCALSTTCRLRWCALFRTTHRARHRWTIRSLQKWRLKIRWRLSVVW